MTTTAPVTHVATTDIAELLAPDPPGRRMAMRGFDDEFVDIADYIIRITDRIWHERKVALCRRYYSEDSMIHTLAGDIVGAATVEANTHATLAAFPDRTLDGDNVTWSGNENDGFYSSHLITSRMTNLGASEFGPATGKRARIKTIADCLCRENQVIEEWLVRDNAALIMQLGLDIEEIAAAQAREDRENGVDLISFFEGERERIAGQFWGEPSKPVRPEEDIDDFVRFAFNEIWNKKNGEALPAIYDFRVGAHLPAEISLYGTLEYNEYLQRFFEAVSQINVSVNHVASIPYLGDARDVAVRWTLTGTHSGDGLFGEASGAPLYILGVSHWRLINGRIREEPTIFDALAIRRQIATHRFSHS